MYQKMSSIDCVGEPIAVSPPGEKPVTSVTSVTPTTHDRNERDQVAFRLENEASAIAPLVRQWVRQECFVSSGCYSSMRGLYRAFVRWAGSPITGGMSGEFARLLHVLGFVPDEAGMLSGLVLAEDLVAAMVYSRARANFPAKDRWNLNDSGGETSMALIIKNEQKQYELPDEGQHSAVLADVTDLGEQDTKFGKKRQVRLTWLLDQLNSEGKQIRVMQRFNWSLHEMSRLYKLITALTGRRPGNQFDLEKLLGANALLFIQHNVRDGRTFANVASIAKPRKGSPLLSIPADFVRAKDNKDGGNGSGNNEGVKQNGHAKAGQPGNSVQNLHGVDVTDDDVEFPGDDAADEAA